jgi:hypothetical protein
MSVNQKIAGGFTGGVLGQFQHSAFNGGSDNGKIGKLLHHGFELSLTASTPYLSVEGGYNWNKLVSDISGRDYTRNMVYLGVRATY